MRLMGIINMSLFSQLMGFTTYPSRPFPQLMVKVDPETYVHLKPKSALAELIDHSIWYKNVRGSMPTDSFPGTAALYTGATPRTHRVWYDNVWDRTYYPFAAGCTCPMGFNVACDKTIDVDLTKLDGGGAFDLRNLPYQKTGLGSLRSFVAS